MRPARLEFADAAGKQQAVSVDHTPFRIGRSHSNNLTLQAAEVSREHAEIIWDGHQFQLLDRESRAGTFVNDDPVTERRLASGDRIRLGPNFEIVFAIEEGDPDDTASTSASSTAITDLRQTALLLEALSALGSTRVLEHVLDLVLDSAIDVAGAERGFIMLVSPSGKTGVQGWPAPRPRVAGRRAIPNQPEIPEDVFRTGQTRLVEDLLEPAVAPDHDHTIALGIREVLCAPLKMVQFVELGEAPEEERRIGVLYLDSRERKSFRSTSMRAALETLANEAAVAIENARLYREAQDKASLEQDLRTAYEFQQALLPKAAPALGYFDAAALMVPCRMIGGDFFEYVTLDEGAFGFTLGDVAGKGAPAGLLGARIQEIFSAHAPLLVDPASTVDQINTTLLRRSLESRFVTMFYGILYRDGRLRFCNGGHNPPILIAADGVKRLQTGGLIVGLFDDAVFEEETQQMAPGDLLVVFSDGITEATNDQGEEFGDDRIIECVRETGAARDPQAVLTRMFDRLKEFTVDELPGDDMTALVLRYTGAGD